MLYDAGLQYIIKTDYSPNWGFREHSHSFWQLLYVLEGERNCLINGQTMRAKPDDCILFKPGVKHSLQSGEATFLVADIKFSVSNEELRRILMGLENPIHCADNSVLNQIDQMLGLLHVSAPKDVGRIYNKTSGAREALTVDKDSIESTIIDACFNTILLQLIRFHYMNVAVLPGEGNREGEQFKGRVGKKVDHYIRGNYMEPISLADIAAHLGYNKNYLCQEFKRQTGKSVFQHLYDVRLEIAKNLLRLSDYTLESIVEKTGFASVNHFNRSFKKKYGMAPGKYRKRAADNLWAPVLMDERNVNIEEMYGGNLTISDNKCQKKTDDR